MLNFKGKPRELHGFLRALTEIFGEKATLKNVIARIRN